MTGFGFTSCGCDLVRVPRLQGLLARHPDARARLFSEGELADAVRDGADPDGPVALRRLAARFAAKEATVKALRQPRLSFQDVEVRTNADGAPSLWLHGREAPELSVSLSHDGDLAMAFVVATARPEPVSTR